MSRGEGRMNRRDFARLGWATVIAAGDRAFVFRQGGRYRLVFHNRSDDSHPLHIHCHIQQHMGFGFKALFRCA